MFPKEKESVMKFHYLARAIILNKGKVLLAHQIGASNTFLPGGHIESCEPADLALIREIKEEIGYNAVIKGFVGAVEHSCIFNDVVNHEINLVFEVLLPEIDSTVSPVSNEKHLEFIWALPSELMQLNLLPFPMIDCIINIPLNGKPFWGSTLKNIR